MIPTTIDSGADQVLHAGWRWKPASCILQPVQSAPV